jgi:heme exporter protein A
MIGYTLEAKEITKTFGRRLIFEGISFSYEENEVIGISGPNGSGKSTLVKIIADLLSPTKGKIIHKYQEKEIIPEKLHNHIGFVSPYLILYEEFSAWENLNYFARIRGVNFETERIEKLLDHFLLLNRKDDLVKTYSSGMKQRMKFIFALMHSPELLILDEPTSNLDIEGKNSVYEIVKDKGRNNIVIIASNETADLDLCDNVIHLEKYKR